MVMTTAGWWLAVGTPIAVLLTAAIALQRRSWQRPPRTPAEARRRAAWEQMAPYPQLGVRIWDGFVYANATGRCLGQTAGARAVVLASRPVTTLKPKVGWAVIYFADDTMWRQPYSIRSHTQAMTQAERFNGHATQPGPGVFRRARPAPQPASRG